MTRPLYEIWLPLLPSRMLSPNGQHGHWAAVAEARSELRVAVMLVAVNDLRAYGAWTPPAQAAVGIVLKHNNQRRRDSRYRPRDVPNLISACKPVYDGLTDAKIILGDDMAHMTLGDTRIETIAAGSEEGLLITVREAP